MQNVQWSTCGAHTESCPATFGTDRDQAGYSCNHSAHSPAAVFTFSAAVPDQAQAGCLTRPMTLPIRAGTFPATPSSIHWPSWTDSSTTVLTRS